MFNNYSEIHVKYDYLSGCTFIIVLNTKDGERCSGGTRMHPYVSFDNAISDAIQLTQNMSKKCRIIGDEFNGGFSGGKGVIIGDPIIQKSPDMLRRFGEFINSLGGKFITGTDLNIYNEDAGYMAEVSPYVDGLNSGIIGDTAIGTAYGIVCSIKKILNLYYENKGVSDLKICVQGCGSVGSRLIELLAGEGAQLYVADTSHEKLKRFVEDYNVHVVPVDEIYDVDCDIFSPNAIGGVISEETIQRLRCRFIIGAANNQLRCDDRITFSNIDNGMAMSRSSINKMDQLLQNKNIIYLPDYLVNIGGVYSSICEQRNQDIKYMLHTLDAIINSGIDRVYNRSISEGMSILQASELIYN